MSNTLSPELQAIKESREKVAKGLSQVVPDDVAPEIDVKMKSLTLEELVALNDTELLKFNELDEERLIIAPPELGDSEKEIQFIRDYLVFIKKSTDFLDQMDARVAEFNTLVEETNEKLSVLTDADAESNVVHITRLRLTKAIEQARDERSRKMFTESLEAFEDSFKLTRLIDLYKNIKAENLHREARTDGTNLYMKYKRASKELNLKADLSNLADFEKTCLDEKYHDMENTFVVICMKYIGRLTKTRGADSRTDGLFAAQLTTNIYLAMNDGLPAEEKEVFLKSVSTLLDLVR